MLRSLRPWLCPFRQLLHAVCLSAGRRRNFCRIHFFRAQPLATSSGSTAARLILPDRVGLSGIGRISAEGNSTGGFRMKYLLAIVAALALVGTASATSRSADCCGGGSCCLIKSGCCAK
jgi:hypothetical protein